MDIAEREEQVVLIRRVDGRDALRGEAHANRLLETWQLKRLVPERLPGLGAGPDALAGVERGAQGRDGAETEAEDRQDGGRHDERGRGVDHAAAGEPAVEDPAALAHRAVLSPERRVTVLPRTGTLQLSGQRDEHAFFAHAAGQHGA